jgi:hypothetical protein
MSAELGGVKTFLCYPSDLELSSPNVLRRILNQTTCEVALNATNQIMFF